MKDPLSIGMFDSGIGGLTVMRQLVKKLPNESIVYFGDTARLPYGEKSAETIVRYSIENTILLLEQQIKILVIACNTASASALTKLRQYFNIPIIDVIEPGALRAAKVTKNKKIAVLGTKGTIASGAYQKALHHYLPEATLFPIACPLFVPLVEEGMYRHPISRMVVEEYLHPLKKQSIDTILLGCTHYPLLKETIQEVVGDDIAIVDSASTCAEHVADALIKLSTPKVKPNQSPFYRFITSDHNEKFKLLGEQFLGIPIKEVEIKHSF